VLSSICYAEGTPLLCHFGTPHPLILAENSTKSNYSRTYGPFSRKSNHSRTYAKTGGWGVSRPVQTGRKPDKADREDS
jgi:hypothetical protein